MDSLSENFAQKSFRSVGRSRDEVGVGATLPAAFNRTLFDHETRSRCIGSELALFVTGPFAIMGRPARDKSQAVLLHPPAQSRDNPALAPSVQPDARFHFANRERHVIHLEFEVSHAVFLDEEHFLLQLKFATQPDSSDQPYLDFAIEREIEPAGQFDGGQLAPRQPARVTLARSLSVKIEFALHSRIGKPGSGKHWLPDDNTGQEARCRQ